VFSLIKNIFQYSPPFIKDLALSAYGYRRNGWRYDRNTKKLIEEAALREQWSFSEWKLYQENHLDKLLHRAYHTIPFYRDHWSKRRQKGDNSPYSNLLNWPIIDKQVVMSNTFGFLSDDCNPKRMYHEHTGGTSGSPLNVYWSKATTLQYYAIFEGRIRNWNGVTKDMRYGILGGQMFIPFSQNKPPFWVRNFSMNQLYMSSYHISKDSIADYLSAMTSFGIEYLFGYASSLYSIALLGLQQDLTFPSLRVVISNAEPLFDFQVDMITKAFGCKVVNTYGMSELVSGGCTSPLSTGLIELWPEVGIIEVDNSSEFSKFICTGILNQDMGLVRYNLGDNGKLIYPSAGRLDYFKIEKIHGRDDDMVVTRDGRRIGRLDTVFKNDLGILEAQIIQDDLEHFTIKIVPDGIYNTGMGIKIAESLRERVGDVDVKIELVNRIQKTKMGKFRAVISRINTV
jgi:phenylacetate-CoA ligase